MLDDAGTDVGEPLNIIISGLSSPEVLTYDGFYNYAQAIGLCVFNHHTNSSNIDAGTLNTSSEECLDIHLGGPQSANLGDGGRIYVHARSRSLMHCYS